MYVKTAWEQVAENLNKERKLYCSIKLLKIYNLIYKLFNVVQPTVADLLGIR